MSLRNARLVQVVGLFIAVVGLLGFWWTRDVAPAELTLEQQQLLGVTPEQAREFRASFVLAGRDYDHTRAASPCRWVRGECIRERTGDFVLGNRTDTIIYVGILGTKITMINIPRDLYLPEWRTKVNAMYHYRGAAGLKDSVADILGLPVDHYAIVNIDIFKDLVDALGGVNVNVPYRMYYRDAAAGLEIDLQEGPQLLSGEQAAGFVRFRETNRGDIDRIDNVKRLANAILGRLKDLNLRAALALPGLIDATFSNIETNASPALLSALLPRLQQLQIEAVTLPTCCDRRDPVFGDVLGVNPAAVEGFLAETFGGTARSFAEAPEATLLITNRSGQAGLESLYRARLVAMGVPEERVVTREGSSDPAPTRILTTAQNWLSADYYASLLQTGKQQIDRLPSHGALAVDLELVLGMDARSSGLAVTLGTPAWADAAAGVGAGVGAALVPDPQPSAP